MDIIILHILLGIILFFIINWIGKHSYSIGYIEITLFVRTEEAPALNFLIRVLTPIVFIIIISTILYNFCLDRFVHNIYLVNVYYIIFRLVFNLVTSRGLLLNWYRQFLYWAAIIVISYFTYDLIIKVRSNILPDFTTVSNELWIIILIFIFQITNNIRLSEDGTIKRKQNYLESRYSHFRKLYGGVIKEITKNEILESIAFAILIYEDFNRPKIVRFIENLKCKFTGKIHTLGVMQAHSDKIISDKTSVILGTEKIVKSYKRSLELNANSEYPIYEHSIIYDIIQSYNVGSKYQNEVSELEIQIRSKFYPNTKDLLVPNN